MQSNEKVWFLTSQINQLKENDPILNEKIRGLDNANG